MSYSSLDTWIKIDIVLLSPEQIEVMMTRANADPLLMSRIDLIMREIAKCWPTHSVLASTQSNRSTIFDGLPERGRRPDRYLKLYVRRVA